VTNGLELLRGPFSSVAQDQQGTRSDLDLGLLDGASSPMQCLFGHLDDGVEVGAGVSSGA
jgi:hypothetical protein